MIRRLNEEYINIDRSVVGVYAEELYTVGDLGRDVTSKCKSILDLIKTSDSMDGTEVMNGLEDAKRDLYVVLNKLDLLCNLID